MADLAGRHPEPWPNEEISQSAVWRGYFRAVAATFPRFLVWLMPGLLAALLARAQVPGPARVVVAPGPVAVDQPFEVRVELPGTRLEKLGAFPELPGFKKTTRSRQTITRVVQSKDTLSTLIITQRYLAFGEGEKVLPPFTIQVNGQPVRYPGGKVRITAATTLAGPDKKPDIVLPPDAVGYATAADLFGKPKPQEYRDVPDEARLYLEVAARPVVWAGEGVRARIYLTLAPEDQAVLAFGNDFGRQMEQMHRQIKPADVWEETPSGYPTVPDTLRLPDGHMRLRILLHDAVYYPLTTHPLRFPPVSLRLIKYRLAKKPLEGATNRQATVRVLTTEPAEVPVRALPPHPLRDVVPVGQFRLREELRHNPARVNQPTRYVVEIAGPGNLAPVRFPDPLTGPEAVLAAYRPQITLNPAWPPAGPGAAGGRVRFQWEVVAGQPGTWRLDSLISLVYFDPVRARYDTLRSALRWRVTGKPQPTASTEAPWLNDDFYRRIDRESLRAPVVPDPAELRRLANGALAVLAALGGWLAMRRRSA